MKIISVDDETIKFDDGTTIEYYHDQDCCEHVYADFIQLQDTDIFQQSFTGVEIEGVKDSGFRLNGYFVPCYNVQNGWYSSDLVLVITAPAGKTRVDISDYVKDLIH